MGTIENQPPPPAVQLPPPLKAAPPQTHASKYLLEIYGLRIAPSKLAKYASVGGGPDNQKTRRSPLCLREGLGKWAMKRLGRFRSNTSDRAPIGSDGIPDMMGDTPADDA